MYEIPHAFIFAEVDSKSFFAELAMVEILVFGQESMNTKMNTRTI